ncbi:MAG: penicillin-binding protein activator [Myxococcota bacterium]
MQERLVAPTRVGADSATRRKQGRRLPTGPIVLTSIIACASHTAVVDGQTVTTSEAADISLAQGNKAERNGSLRDAESHYRNILDLYKGTSAEPAALNGLARIKQETSGCDAARIYDERLLNEYPRTSEAKDAERRRRACHGFGGSPDGEAPPTLLQAYSEASQPAEKLRIASEAADAALDGGDASTAVMWLVEMLRWEQEPSARSGVEDEIAELIRTRVSARGLRRLLERSQPGRFPHELLAFKLGQIQIHVGDLANGRETLEDFVQRYPDSPFAEDARVRLRELDARQSVQPTRLGVLLPLSGRHKNYGELAMRAIRMVWPEGETVELVVRDTKSDAVEAAEQTRKLVLEDHVIAILGPIFTYEARTAANEAQTLSVPLLTVSTANEVANMGAYVFRNGISNEAQAKAIVAYAMDVMGMRRFAVLYPRHPYGEELLHLFWDEVDARRGEIRGVESYGLEDTTFSSQVKALVARDDLDRRQDYRKALEECQKQPDPYRKARCRENVRKNLRPLIDFEGLFIPDYPRSISMISAALAFEDVIVERDPERLEVIEKTLGRSVTPVTLLGASGWNSDELIERADRNVENAVFTDAFYAQSDDPETQAFVSRYRETHGRTPRLYPEALLYDSARIIRRVFELRPQTRPAFRDALSRISDFAGVTGRTSFDGGTDASKDLKILTIRDGHIRLAPPDGVLIPEQAEPKGPRS